MHAGPSLLYINIPLVPLFDFFITREAGDSQKDKLTFVILVRVCATIILHDAFYHHLSHFPSKLLLIIIFLINYY